MYVRRSQLVAAWALLFVTLWGAWRCSGDKEERWGGGRLFTGALGTHTHTHTLSGVCLCTDIKWCLWTSEKQEFDSPIHRCMHA